MEHSNHEQTCRCEEIARRLIARYDWQLLDHATFAQRIHAVATPDADLTYTAYGIYNQALHAACSGTEGPPRWERAYYELFQMLCGRARHRYPDVWEDAVQSAIELTCARFARCAIPRAFFQFAWGHMLNAVRVARREAAGADLSIEGTVGDSGARLADSIPDSRPSILKRMSSAEARAQLHTILAEFERLHRRARNQLAAVRLKFLDGQNDEAIGRMLGVSVKRVHELRSLGIKKLRADPRLREMFEREE